MLVEADAQTTLDSNVPLEDGAWSFDPALKVRLLVMQPTPFCNISCNYCYLAGRDDSRRMSPEVVQAAARQLAASRLLDQSLGVVWHAGEPLTAGLKFYDEAFADFERLLGNRVRIGHSIQTNATLIDERWCELFKRWDIRVGVSLDGPADLHDKHRKTRQGRSTFTTVMRGVEALQREGVDFHVIAVLTEDSLARADEIYDFFVDRGIREVGFNVDEQEGINRWSTVGRHDARHQAFLQRMLDRSMADPTRLHVRELEVAARLIMQPLPEVLIDGLAYPDNAQILPMAILSVAANGDLSTFSPELVDQRHPAHGPFVFGNVLCDPLPTLLQTSRFAAIFREILAGVAKCRSHCEYFRFCGGGAPANKLAEHGSLHGAETAYCKAVVKHPLDVVLQRFERANTLAAERLLAADSAGRAGVSGCPRP